MKIALIADTHWGIRSDSEYFMNNMKMFLDNVFFPYIDQHKIKKIIHLGDIVDRQKYINYVTAKRLREDFLEPIVAKKIHMDVILGNHDYYYKQITGVNAFRELLREYPGIQTFTTATEVDLDKNLKALYVPWLCDQNRAESIKAIKKTKAPIVFGHLELSGFEMHKGVFHEGGDDPRIFRKFDTVCTGHFHHKSSFSNINYLGSPAQFTWSDFGDQRGFHTFDTKTRELEFIPNPHNAFEKIYYNDSGKQPEDVLKLDFTTVKKKFVKIVVQSKTNIPLFDEFTLRIEEQGPTDIVIVDDHLNLDLVSDTTIETEAKDTLTIFREFIKQANTVISSEKLDNMIVSLYQEALSLE